MSQPVALKSQVTCKNDTPNHERKTEAATTIRKGFFTKSARSPVTVVTPDMKRCDPLLIPEVQRAMQSPTTTLLQDKSWMNEDLMKAIMSDPLLSKSMTDPKFQDALALMQKDPKSAKAKYERDPEVTAMLTKFMGLFGTHFESLAKKAPEEPKQDLQSILSSDPELGKIVMYIQQGGQVDPRRLPPQLFAKVKHLIDKGILQIHT